MKKRNLRPQQAAPVARETNTTSDQQGFMAPQIWMGWYPFAGDDAE
ncbi:MAG: anacyclamide/piricyclamide family prenylated cyclic peptide [Gloeotrichia echinulata GP01]